MANETEGTNGQAIVRLEKKYIRVQEVGISFLLAMPFSLQLLLWIGQYKEEWILLSLLILGCAGVYCMWYGDQKRKELHKPVIKDSAGSNSPEFPKQ